MQRSVPLGKAPGVASVCGGLLLILCGAPGQAQVVPRNIDVLATSPHTPDDRDPCDVTVLVSDDAGNPVADARIYVEASAPAINLRVGQPAVHLRADNLGGGVYHARFTSPLPGPIVVTASDLVSDANGSTEVQFVAPADLPQRRVPTLRPTLAARPADDIADCKAFFEDLDNNTFPTILVPRIRATIAKAVAGATLTAAEKTDLTNLSNKFVAARPLSDSDRQTLSALVDRVAGGAGLTAQEKTDLKAIRDKVVAGTPLTNAENARFIALGAKILTGADLTDMQKMMFVDVGLKLRTNLTAEDQARLDALLAKVNGGGDLTAQEKATLAQDLKAIDAVLKVMAVMIPIAVEIEKIQADNPAPNADQKRKIAELQARLALLKDSTKPNNLVAALQLLSTIQITLLKKYFPDGSGGINFAKVQTCMEMFDNFKLVPAGGFGANSVVRGPDAPEAYLRWAKFAECCIDTNVDKDTWTRMLKPLVKGFFIVKNTGFTGRRDPGTGKIKPPPRMLTDAEVKALRDAVDPLDLPGLRAKLIQAIKEAKLAGLVGARRQIEGMPSYVATAALTASSGLTTGQALASGDVEMLNMAQDGGVLFGYGVDRFGHAYTVLGSVQGSQASFTVAGLATEAGFGTATAAGDPPSTVYTGTITPGRITGTLAGSAAGVLQGLPGSYQWAGTFTLVNVADVNQDGLVDQTDLSLVAARLGTVFGGAGFDARADINGDGVVDLRDLVMAAQNVGRDLAPVP